METKDVIYSRLVQLTENCEKSGEDNIIDAVQLLYSADEQLGTVGMTEKLMIALARFSRVARYGAYKGKPSYYTHLKRKCEEVGRRLWWDAVDTLPDKPRNFKYTFRLPWGELARISFGSDGRTPYEDYETVGLCHVLSDIYADKPRAYSKLSYKRVKEIYKRMQNVGKVYMEREQAAKELFYKTVGEAILESVLVGNFAYAARLKWESIPTYLYEYLHVDLREPDLANRKWVCIDGKRYYRSKGV